MPHTHQRRPRFTIIVMVLLSLTVLTLSSKDIPVLGSVRSAVLDVMGPVGRGFRSATKPVRNWWGGVNDYEELQQENVKLRDEVDRLTAKQIVNASAAEDLKRLQEQLGLPFAEDIKGVVAQVATGPYSSFDDNTIVIDRGESSGLKPKMPVVTSKGLVGRIASVTKERAVVQLITDPDFVVGVRLASSGNIAVGHGTGPNSPFVVDRGVELAQEVNKGEGVLTSGLTTGVFPKDIPIGRVTSVAPSQSEQTQKLEIQIAADLVRLNVVQVLIWEPPA